MTSAIDGYKVCIFAYGQTGSGKTHTMQGTKDNPGIYHRAIEHLFDTCRERKACEFKVKLSLLEIYNDKIRDLILPADKSPIKLVPR